MFGHPANQALNPGGRFVGMVRHGEGRGAVDAGAAGVRRADRRNLCSSPAPGPVPMLRSVSKALRVSRLAECCAALAGGDARRKGGSGLHEHHMPVPAMPGARFARIEAKIIPGVAENIPRWSSAIRPAASSASVVPERTQAKLCARVPSSRRLRRASSQREKPSSA